MLDCLTLHLGHPKTGTSSIQETLRASSAALLGHGIYYDPTRRHHFLARMFRGGDAAARQAERAALIEWSERVGASGAREAILSSELLAALPPEAVTSLLECLAPFARRIRGVLYVRHPVSNASSAAHEAVRVGRPILEYCARPRRWHLRSIVETWSIALGDGNLILRGFDRNLLVNGDAVDDMMHAIGHERALEALTRRRVNESLSRLGLALLARAHVVTAGVGLNRQTMRRFNEIAGPRYVLPRASLDRVREEARADLAYLSAQWGLVLPEPDDAPTPLPDLSDEELDSLLAKLFRLPSDQSAA